MDRLYSGTNQPSSASHNDFRKRFALWHDTYDLVCARHATTPHEKTAVDAGKLRVFYSLSQRLRHSPGTHSQVRDATESVASLTWEWVPAQALRQVGAKAVRGGGETHNALAVDDYFATPIGTQIFEVFTGLFRQLKQKEAELSKQEAAITRKVEDLRHFLAIRKDASLLQVVRWEEQVF